MPTLQIFTNLSRSKIPSELAEKCAKLLTTTLRNKPLHKMCIHIAPEQIMWAGSMTDDNQPTIFAQLNSIDSVTLEDNRKTIAALTTLLENELKVEKNEIRIMFQDVGGPDMAGSGGVLITDQK